MPDTPSTTEPVTNPVPGVGDTLDVEPGVTVGEVPTRPAWDTRAGTVAQGADFGSPYDPDHPTYSVYNDPGRAAVEQAEEQERARQEAAADVKGSEYRFLGHEGDPYEGTVRISGVAGTIERGGTGVLTDEEFALLTQAGFRLEVAGSGNNGPTRSELLDKAKKLGVEGVTSRSSKDELAKAIAAHEGGDQ
jgi:hypothetical protein